MPRDSRRDDGEIMRAVVAFLDRWISRASGVYSFWPLIPAGAVGVIGAVLASGSIWLGRAGPFEWFMAGLVCFAISGIVLGVLAKAKIWRVQGRLLERVAGSSSAFDPMDKVYRDKRLYLHDLAPVGRKRVTGKKFINCEIIGPGTAIIGLDSDPEKKGHFSGIATLTMLIALRLTRPKFHILPLVSGIAILKSVIFII